MAERPYVQIKTPHDGPISVYEWDGLTNGDVGQWLVLPTNPDKTVQLLTLPDGAVEIQGTLDVAAGGDVSAAQAHVLNDPQGNPLSLGVAKIETVLENVYAIRPNRSAGTGSAKLRIMVGVR